jgi:hypothetical protein
MPKEHKINVEEINKIIPRIAGCKQGQKDLKQLLHLLTGEVFEIPPPPMNLKVGDLVYHENYVDYKYTIIELPDKTFMGIDQLHRAVLDIPKKHLISLEELDRYLVSQEYWKKIEPSNK